MSTKTVQYVPYKVRDISLAAWGRKEIELAEAEMPGLSSSDPNLPESNENIDKKNDNDGNNEEDLKIPSFLRNQSN